MNNTPTNADRPSGQRSYEDVMSDAVRVLTEAARRVVTTAYPDGYVHHERADFAEFATHALAGAAANLGSIESLLEGRNGSWEADRIRDLLHSIVGGDEEALLEYRTEPLTVFVHVEDILHDLGVRGLYDEAYAELDRRYDAIGSSAATANPGDAASEAVVGLVQPATPVRDAAVDVIDELKHRLDEQRRREWTAYGEAFKAQLLLRVEQVYPLFSEPVHVVIERSWQGTLGPDEVFDRAEWRLWEAALYATPLPGSGIALNDYAIGTDVAQVERAAGRAPLTRLEGSSPEGSA